MFSKNRTVILGNPLFNSKLRQINKLCVGLLTWNDKQTICFTRTHTTFSWKNFVQYLLSLLWINPRCLKLPGVCFLRAIRNMNSELLGYVHRLHRIRASRWLHAPQSVFFSNMNETNFISINLHLLNSCIHQKYVLPLCTVCPVELDRNIGSLARSFRLSLSPAG